MKEERVFGKDRYPDNERLYLGQRKGETRRLEEQILRLTDKSNPIYRSSLESGRGSDIALNRIILTVLLFYASFLCNLNSLANKWNDFSKSVALISYLRGKARVVLDGVTDLEKLNYVELKSNLEFRFGEGHLALTYYSQFTNRRQKFGKDLIELRADLECLSHLAYPECSHKIQIKLSVRNLLPLFQIILLNAL